MGPVEKHYGKPLRVMLAEARPYLRHVDTDEWGLALGAPVVIVGASFGLPWWGAGILALIYGLLALLVVLAAAEKRQEANKLGADLQSLFESVPFGAPRIVEVPCRHGDMHRYQWVDGRWEAVGPAVREV